MSEDLLEFVEEDLPSLDEIERFASGGARPKSCTGSLRECAARILLTLTRKTYPPDKAERLWQAIVAHEKWVTGKLGRRSGVSVAALDYLMNVAGDWDQAVVAEVEQIETLADAATLDGLTGLYSRDIFDQWLAKSVAESQRYGDPLSLLMADIDDFKAVNDTYGHQIGDTVLATIGSAFLDNLRSADFAARYGGEELVAVLPHTRGNSAAIVAEKIRKAVSDQQFENRLGVTISIGVACWHEDINDSAGLIQAADRALYAAKEAGKNRVVIHEP
ncbi:MAG: GGDEF domain-containing protein [Desulfosarcina sp.]|nr:GGDEF domain-containing protein [Desulfosarcina sp.]